MKHVILSFFVFTTLVCRSQDTVSLQKVTLAIDTVMNELLISDNFQKTFKPTKATITLATELGSEKSGEIKVLIFKIGGKRSTTKASEMTFEYKILLRDIKAFEGGLTKVLSKAIRDAYISYLNSHPKFLELEKFTVKVSFVIERTGSGNAEIELKPITLSLGKSVSKKVSHTVEIEFTK